MANIRTIGCSVAEALPDARALFIRRTYSHLAAAVVVFVGVEYVLIGSPVAEVMLRFAQGSQYGWLGVLGAFILCGWLARGMAANVASVPMQYVGLTIYVLAEAVIFLPLIFVARQMSDPTLLPTAGILTLLLFGGLTTVAFVSRKDFSFLGSILTIGGFLALGLIVCSAIFGFNLGLVFSIGMVALAAGAILYDTSKIIHNYNTDQHVAASLQLFASVALLFWYVLRILMRLRR